MIYIEEFLKRNTLLDQSLSNQLLFYMKFKWEGYGDNELGEVDKKSCYILIGMVFLYPGDI